MRIHEVFEPLPSFDLDEDLDEDLRSIRNKALAAAAAGGLAFGANALTNQSNASAADMASAVQTNGVEQSTASKNLDQNTMLLAQTIWGEARGHGTEGMRAVGHVIKNRLASERNFGDSIKQVVHKPWAFSCWNKGDPNREAMQNLDDLKPGTPDHKRWEEAKHIAHEILSGKSKDPTNGALFYHTDGVDPEWAEGQTPVSKVSNHTFYRTDAKA